jgi:carboxyl-terminal processing protease
MIRGKKGTKVVLQIQSHDSVPGSPPSTIELVRDVIQLEDQAAKLSEVEIGTQAAKENYAVISIPSFYANHNKNKKPGDPVSTSYDVAQLLKSKQVEQANGLIIDLRGNGGGYLTEAIKLTGLFIESGPIVQVQDSNGRNRVLPDRDNSIAYSGPLLVLLDRLSASASEIFAAALQDYGRAIVVGERSFGKGTVQQVVPLRKAGSSDHESQVKFTTAQFFRINGGSTQHKGVVPDILLNSGAEDEEFGERSYDNALPWSEIKAASYQSRKIDPSLIETLSNKHYQRSLENPAFSYLRENTALISNARDVKVLSLNIEERRKMSKDREAQSLALLNTYRKTLNLEPVTKETRKDNPLPDDDEHWNIVRHKEAAKILSESIQTDEKFALSWSANLVN